MTFLQLEYFRKIVEMKSITAAANELHVSQPALSKVLHSLESELGCRLFIRNGRSYILSQNGEIYLRHVNSIFQALSDAKMEMSDPNVLSGTVTVSPHIGTAMLPQIITAFREQYPNICIKLVKRQFSPARSTTREADLYLTNCNKRLNIYSSIIDTMKLVHSEELLTEDLLYGVSTQSPLAQRDSISLRELQHENIIMLPEISVTRQIVERCTLMNGFLLHPCIECSEWNDIVSLVKRNAGGSFFPRYSWLSLDQEDMVFLRIQDANMTRTILCSWPDTQHVPQAVRLFRDSLIDYYCRFTRQNPPSSLAR